MDGNDKTTPSEAAVIEAAEKALALSPGRADIRLLAMTPGAPLLPTLEDQIEQYGEARKAALALIAKWKEGRG